MTGYDDAKKIAAVTYEPVYSPKGECLLGGTLEEWDKLPNPIALPELQLGDVVKVQGMLWVWTGIGTGWMP